MQNVNHRPASAQPPSSHLPHYVHHGRRVTDHDYLGHIRDPGGTIIPFRKIAMGATPPDVDMAHTGHGEFCKDPHKTKRF